MNKKTNEIFEKISKDWSTEPRIISFCKKVTEHLLRTSNKDTSHLTNHSFKKILGETPSNEEFIKTVRYLSGSINIIEIAFDFNDNIHQPIEIPHEEVLEFRRTGVLVNPNTGDIVESPEDFIFLFFRPTTDFLTIKESNAKH